MRCRLSTRFAPTIAVLVVAIAAIGCISDESSATEDTGVPRRPTAAEASRLAATLARNGAAGGAVFVAQTTLQGTAVEIDGVVDWTQQRVEGAVSVPTDVRFVTDGSVVDESFPGLPESLTGAGFPEGQWIQRPFSADEGLVDIVSEVVVGLASDARDNPVLVRDQAQFLGSETIGGVATSRFAYGDATTLWIDAGGDLLRFEGDVDRLGAVVRVDLRDLGPRSIAMPDLATVVPIGQVPALYGQFTGS